jgi:TolB-like protein/Tfp pilus assembly protein PilF
MVETDTAADRVDRGEEKRRRRTILYSSVAAFVVLLVVVGLLLVTERDEGIDSIAVLPLENLSGDPTQDYFADGMTEELISSIAKVSALRVISRTSVMRYKDTDKSLPQIAGELDVDAIVEGSVLRSGDRIRISAQLIHAAKDRHLWAESYERELHDVLSLQSELARVIANRINIELTPQEHSALASTDLVDPEAHEAYLKGRFHWNKRTREGLEKSVVFFEQAIAHDPMYALAYAGLADAYICLADMGYRSPRECYPLAKELVAKALEIDENLAEAHNTKAYITGMYEWRWAEAEPGFKRSIELNANYATAHQWYAEYLYTLGRFDEAIEQAQRAQELDPLSVIIHVIAGAVYYTANRFDEAIEQFQRSLEIDGDFYASLHYMANSLREEGRHDEAFEMYLKTLYTLGLSEGKEAELRQIFDTSGLQGYYRWFVDEGYNELGAIDGLQYDVLVGCVYLGERDLAFEWLERFMKEKRRDAVEIAVDPVFAELHSDPRFVDLLRQMGLEH